MRAAGGSAASKPAVPRAMRMQNPNNQVACVLHLKEALEHSLLGQGKSRPEQEEHQVKAARPPGPDVHKHFSHRRVDRLSRGGVSASRKARSDAWKSYGFPCPPRIVGSRSSH